MKRYKILYIDDQKINLLLLSETFGNDYFIVTAESGEEGLEIVKNEHVDLVISDQAMPHMTGVEFFEQLLKINPEPNRILLTAFNDLNALAEAINTAKIYRYVKKPWSRDELKIIIDAAIEDYVLRRKNNELTERLKYHTTKLREMVRVKTELLDELEKSKAELEENEKNLKKIIELSPIPIGISNKKNTIIELNKQFNSVFGYTFNDIKTVDDWYIKAYPELEFRENHKNQWKERLTKIKSSNLPMEPLETMVVCKNGEKLIIQLHASVIGDNLIVMFNDLTKIRSLEQDISYRIKMEEEILKAKLAAESANKAKSEFIASMSHEIRTPMNAILGYAEVLSQEITDSIQSDYINSIRSSGKTLLSLINDILDFSKIEAGKIELHKEAVNIRLIVHEIADIFKFKIKEKKLEFITDVEKGIPSYFILDELRIKQVLINLISNSLKFTDKGFIKISVETKNNVGGKNDLIIHVEDSGIGIAKEQQKRVFNIFEQMEGQDNRKYGGTGLGLAISARLVKIMGGDIILESEKGKGSKFTIHINDVEITENNKLNEVTEDKSKADLEFLPSKIIIVDDIEDNRKVISAHLRKYKFEIMEASNGIEALELIKENKPDLILMDLLMPELDGYETFKKIQNTPEWSDIPVIAITAYTLNNDKEMVLNTGFSGYISKPIDFNEFKKLLIKFLPHSTSGKHINEVVSEYVITEELRKKLPELVAEIESKTFPVLIQLEKIRPKKVVTELSEILISIGNKYDYEVITRYGKSLLNAIKSFNVEKEKELISGFKNFTDDLKLKM